MANIQNIESVRKTVWIPAGLVPAVLLHKSNQRRSGEDCTDLHGEDWAAFWIVEVKCRFVGPDNDAYWMTDVFWGDIAPYSNNASADIGHYLAPATI